MEEGGLWAGWKHGICTKLLERQMSENFCHVGRMPPAQPGGGKNFRRRGVLQLILWTESGSSSKKPSRPTLPLGFGLGVGVFKKVGFGGKKVGGGVVVLWCLFGGWWGVLGCVVWWVGNLGGFFYGVQILGNPSNPKCGSGGGGGGGGLQGGPGFFVLVFCAVGGGGCLGVELVLKQWGGG